MPSPVNPVALLTALTLFAGFPAIASSQGLTLDPTATSPAGALTLARTPRGWVELAPLDGRIAFGVKRGASPRAVVAATPFGDVYARELEASSPVAFGRVHRFGARRGASIRMVPSLADRQMRLWAGDTVFVAESPSPILWNMSSRVRIAFGAGYRATRRQNGTSLCAIVRAFSQS